MSYVQFRGLGATAAEMAAAAAAAAVATYGSGSGSKSYHTPPPASSGGSSRSAEEMARMAAASAAATYGSGKQPDVQTAESVASAAVDPSRKMGPAIFLYAALAAAKFTATQNCPPGVAKADCQRVAKKIAETIADKAESGRKKAGGSALAFMTPSVATTYDLCVGARNSLDATYALVVRQLISVYYALFPAEAAKTIGDPLVLPAFGTGQKNFPDQTVSAKLMKLIKERIVFNGGAMTDQGRRPSNPTYCASSASATEQVDAVQRMKDNRYTPLLIAANRTAAEFVGLATQQSVLEQFAKGVSSDREAEATAKNPAATPAAVDTSYQPPVAADESEAGQQPPPPMAQAGLFGVPLKWWLIGGGVAVGAFFLIRKRS